MLQGNHWCGLLLLRMRKMVLESDLLPLMQVISNITTLAVCVPVAKEG